MPSGESQCKDYPVPKSCGDCPFDLIIGVKNIAKAMNISTTWFYKRHYQKMIDACVLYRDPDALGKALVTSKYNINLYYMIESYMNKRKPTTGHHRNTKQREVVRKSKDS